MTFFFVILSLWTPSRLVTVLIICSAPCRAGATTVSLPPLLNLHPDASHKPDSLFFWPNCKFHLLFVKPWFFFDEVERTLPPTPRYSPFTFINVTTDYILSINLLPFPGGLTGTTSRHPLIFIFFLHFKIKCWMSILEPVPMRSKQPQQCRSCESNSAFCEENEATSLWWLNRFSDTINLTVSSWNAGTVWLHKLFPPVSWEWDTKGTCCFFFCIVTFVLTVFPLPRTSPPCGSPHAVMCCEERFPGNWISPPYIRSNFKVCRTFWWWGKKKLLSWVRAEGQSFGIHPSSHRLCFSSCFN